MSPDVIETFRAGAELLGGGIVAVLSYFLRGMAADFKARHDSHEKLSLEQRDALAAYKLHVAEHYSTKSELARVVEEFTRSNRSVNDKLERIEDKLDRKADKSHALTT